MRASPFNTNQLTHSLAKYDLELCLFVWPGYLQHELSEA